MSRCTMCGRTVEEKYQFCPYCGEKIILTSETMDNKFSDARQKNRSDITLLVTVLLVFFYPLGLLLMWLEQVYSKKTRWIITLGFSLAILLGFMMIIFWTSLPGYRY